MLDSCQVKFEHNSYSKRIMERLTPNVQNAYPVERAIMETGGEGNSGQFIEKDAKARVASIVEKFKTERENAREAKARIESQRQKASEKEPGFTTGRTASGFDKFDPEAFKDNRYLREIAREVSMAIRDGNATPEFLQSKRQEVINQVGRGVVSENWAWNFLNQLGRVEISQRLNQPKSEEHELSQDVSAIVELRKKQGLSAEEAQASRVIFENAFGRKLTEAEFQRIISGRQRTPRTREEQVFETQMKTLELLASNPNRFSAFSSALEQQTPETIKQALSGKGGKLVLGVLLGDIAEREKYFTQLDEFLKKEPKSFVQSLPSLAAEIKREEESMKVKTDPESVKRQKEQFQKEASEKKNKWADVEISGGADAQFHLDELKEMIDSVPEENNEIFFSKKYEIVDNDIIDLRLGEIYGDNKEAMIRARQEWNALREINDPEEFKRRASALFDKLKNQKPVGKSPEEEEKEKREAKGKAGELERTGRVEGRGRSFNIRGIEEILDNIAPGESRKEFLGREPKNIRELAVWIMASDDIKTWGPDGVYPIFTLSEEIDPNTEKKKVNFHENNLIRWLRNKSLEHHNDNPNDPMSPLTSVSIETLYRSVNLLQMKYNKQKYFSDENGNLLTNLADEVVNEAWLFGVRRNKDLAYKQIMTNDSKLFEAIVEMSAKNEHTSGGTLSWFLKQGEDFSDSEGGSKDNRVGDAILAANQIYRNLSDIEKLRQIIPTDSPLFTVEGFKNASRILNGEDFDTDTKGYGNLIIEGNRVYFKDPRTKIHTEIFKPDGQLVSNSNLIKFLNFFPEANPQETNESFVRELVRQSIAKIVKFDDGTSREEYESFVANANEKEGVEEDSLSNDEKRKRREKLMKEYRKVKRINLEWAEVNSWVEQRWSGAAARNDTGYRGYDAWTKMYAQYYRERQSGNRTAGPIGNPHDLQIFRMMSPDMWLALRTESGESVNEVFEEIHSLNLRYYGYPEGSAERKSIEEEKKEAYGKLKFPRWTELDWAANGIKRQSEVWHNILETEDLKFNELAKLDSWGVLRYDRQKFEEVVKDDFIKKRRYAFSSNNAMNYGALTRMRVRDVVRNDKGEIVKDEHGNPKVDFVFKDMYMAEAMFGEVVIDSIRQDWFNGKLEYVSADGNGKAVTRKAAKEGEEFDPEKHGTFQGYLNSAVARERILKNICRAGIAAQIKAHRERGGTTERWDAEVIRKLYHSLHSMPEYQEDPLTGEEKKLDHSQFFSEEDIKWIRSQTNTSRAQLLWEDTYHAGWDAASEAVPDILKMFYKDIIS